MLEIFKYRRQYVATGYNSNTLNEPNYKSSNHTLKLLKPRKYESKKFK